MAKNRIPPDPGKTEPTISVVIPTLGRAALVTRAVKSACDQTFPPIEIIVIVDGSDEETVATLSKVTDSRVHIETLPQRCGGSMARNVGVAIASGTHVAFLDDDDYWLPDRLAHQLPFLLQAQPHLVFGSVVTNDEVHPRRSPREGESIGDYLFVHDRLFVGGETSAMTSTYLAPRDVLLAHPFDTEARYHQDWDLLLRLDAAGVALIHASHADTVVDTRHTERQSISTQTTWHDTFKWTQQHQSQLSPRAQTGCYSTVVAFKSFGRLRAGVMIARAMTRTHAAQPVDWLRLALQLTVPPVLRRAYWKLRS